MIYARKLTNKVKKYAEARGWDKPKRTRLFRNLKEGDVYLIDTLSDIHIEDARKLAKRGVQIVNVVADITLTEPVLDALVLLGRMDEFRELKEDWGVTGYYDQAGIWREEGYVPQALNTELNDDEQLIYWQENSICSKWIDAKILEAWPEARICRELVFLRKLLPYVFVNHRGSKISLLYVKRRIQQIRQ